MIDVETLTLLIVNAAAGLSLGLSVTVLADVAPGRWVNAHPWVAALILLVLWAPFALSGVPPVRRTGNSLVSLYLCTLFLLHVRINRQGAVEPSEPPKDAP